MAAPSISSQCGSELSWAALSARTQAMSQRSDPLSQSQSNLDLSAPNRHIMENNLNAARLEEEFNQLRMASHSRLQTANNQAREPLSQTVPATRSAGRSDVDLQALVQRELQARDNGSARGLSGASVQRSFRSSSLERALHGAPQDIADSCRLSTPVKMVQRITALHQELENAQLALRQARRENKKLLEDKEACISAHQRDIVTLESMLQSVMTENGKLKQELVESKGKSNASRLMESLSAQLEREMVSTLVHSGISNIPQSPSSQGTSSTQTPPLEPEAESLDLSRASIDVTLRCD